jgi:ankyrin repeat protein
VDESLKAAIEAGDTDAVAHLLADDPSLSRGREGDLSAVMVAAYYKQPEIARQLLDARGPADLFEAAALGMEQRVRELVAWDPRAVSACSADGFTALHLAAYFAQLATVRLLLQADAYVEAIAENASKVRPLHSAVAGESLEVVQALLAAKTDVEARQERGFTALMAAAARGSEPMVTALVDAGADPAAENDDGRTALDFAREHGYDELEAHLGR